MPERVVSSGTASVQRRPPGELCGQQTGILPVDMNPEDYHHVLFLEGNDSGKKTPGGLPKPVKLQ